MGNSIDFQILWRFEIYYTSFHKYEKKKKDKGKENWLGLSHP